MNLLLFLALLSITVNPTRITVGDAVIVKGKGDISVSAPFEVWQVKKVGELTVVEGSIYLPGTHRIKVKSGEEEREVVIKVASVLRGGEELQDPELLMEVEGKPGPFLKASAALVAFLLIVPLLVRLVRVLRSRRRPEEKLLMERLSAAEALLRQGRWSDFYSLLSLAVREQLLLRLAVPATSMTVEELRDFFQGGFRPLLELLEAFDVLRFSAAKVEKNQALEHLARLRFLLRLEGE